MSLTRIGVCVPHQQSLYWCDFDLRSYIILELDSIPEDYVLTSKQECGSQILEWTLDYETIMRLLAEK